MLFFDPTNKKLARINGAIVLRWVRGRNKKLKLAIEPAAGAQVEFVDSEQAETRIETVPTLTPPTENVG